MSTDNTEGDFNNTPLRRAWRSNTLTRSRGKPSQGMSLSPQSLSTPCLTEIVSCSGSTFTDTAGREYLDFHGNSLHQIGYSHPKVIEAIKSQLDELSFSPRRFTNKPAVELAKRLTMLAPGNLSRVLFSPGGTSAIGMAMKLARYATGRHKTISMWGTFRRLAGCHLHRRRRPVPRRPRPIVAGQPPCPLATRKKTQTPSNASCMRRATSVPSSRSRYGATIERPEDAYWERVRVQPTRRAARLR